MFFRAALIATLAGASLVSAQSISQQCQNVLTNVATSPDAACLNTNALISIALTSPNSSVVQPVDTWLQGFCKATPCTNTTLSAIITNVTSACESELSSLGLANISTSSLISTVQQFYPTVLDAVCLKISTNNTFCLTQTLNNLQSVVGTLSVSNFVSKIPSLFASGAAVIPSNVSCTDCMKEVYNVISHAEPSITSSISSGFSSECGADFTNGASPTDVFEATGSATAPSKSAGSVLLISRSAVVALAATSLTIVFSAFAILA